jgi:surface polysaccharide O-acyltransferase-like enzyme
MPLFFFLAGMSSKPRMVWSLDEWRVFLKKNVLALVVPYVVWGLVYGSFSYASIPMLFYASWEALAELGTLTSLWYLPAFFCARIIVQLIVSLVGMREEGSPRLAYGISALPLFVIGLLLPHPAQGLPWCVDVAFVAAGFILFGMALRRILLVFAVQTEQVLVATLGASLAGLCLGTIVRGDALELMRMCVGEYGSILWFFANSACGTMVVLVGSMLLIRLAREGSHPFSLGAVTFIGMHTMGIFLLHKPLLQEVLMPLFSSLIHGPELLVVIIVSVCALALSMLLCVVIERYIPELLGQFPVYPTEIASQPREDAQKAQG